jgi:hypothetical protein
MKFPEDVTVGVGIYGLSLNFLEDGVTLNFFFFWQATEDVSSALMHA